MGNCFYGAWAVSYSQAAVLFPAQAQRTQNRVYAVCMSRKNAKFARAVAEVLCAVSRRDAENAELCLICVFSAT